MAAALFTAVSGISAAAAGYLTTTVVNLNSAPVAENVMCDTFRGVSIEGSFCCLDPEGDAVTYSVTVSPKKGTVTVDTDTFTYTPLDGKKGKDTFKYVAIDSYGNISNEAVVTVNIKKQTGAVSYSDMSGNSAWYAATLLAEKGIFTGQRIGSEYIFSPDEPVTRGEFLAMCMELCGAEKADGVIRTGFYDDNEISAWQKPYVTAALVGDIVSGSVRSDGHIVFAPDDGITFAQATVMLNNSLGITDVHSDDVSTSCPVWAQQASVNLESCNISTTDSCGVSTSVMTRADAAKMLLGAVSVIDGRDGSASLLSWAK